MLVERVALLEEEVTVEPDAERAADVELDAILSCTVTAVELLAEVDAAVGEDVVAVVDEDTTGEYM